MASTTRMFTNVQMAAALVGAVFLVVGVAGFAPGITTNNLVHLAFGVAGLAAAYAVWPARTYLVGGGVGYVALWAYGVAVDHGSDASFVPMNDADDWLHVGLGAVMITIGTLTGAGGRVDAHHGTVRQGAMAGDRPAR